jgi:hypothetical protein
MARLGTDGSRRQNGRPACLAWTRSPRDVAIKFVDALGHLRRVQPVESAFQGGYPELQEMPGEQPRSNQTL